MCEGMNITVKVTAAESPSSNKLVEKQNMIIANMPDKLLEEKYLDLDISLSWCLNAKNLLANVHGFSSFQLVFDQNLKLSLHKARAFISTENSKKTCSTLSNNIRTNGDAKYITGDKVVVGNGATWDRLT